MDFPPGLGQRWTEVQCNDKDRGHWYEECCGNYRLTGHACYCNLFWQLSLTSKNKDFRRKRRPKEKRNVGSEECVECEFDQPLFVPSSPIIIFMDDSICMTTGGDMKEAYAALCEVPRIWFIISCKNENTDCYTLIISYSTRASGIIVSLNCSDTMMAKPMKPLELYYPMIQF